MVLDFEFFDETILPILGYIILLIIVIVVGYGIQYISEDSIGNWSYPFGILVGLIAAFAVYSGVNDP